MTTLRKSGLGRNLNALLGDALTIVAKAEQQTDEKLVLKNMPIEKLKSGVYQPRSWMDEGKLQELADSIKVQGIIQPIVIRPTVAKDYEIVAGERRWRAAQLAGLTEVPVIIQSLSDEATIAIALIENIQREDLNPIEEARALSRLLNEFNLTHAQVAEAVGKSRTTVTNLMRLMQLQDEVKTALEQGALEMGHARALLSLEGRQQIALARQVIAKRLTVRETERLVRLALNPKPLKKKIKENPDVKRLERDLGEKIGAKLEIEQGVNGRGKLIIYYHSLDELEGVLAHIV